jgi:hypothetical protein
MTVYVAEISGRGIVAFDAANEDAAQSRLADRAFRRDLYVFQTEGRALWDGVSEIRLRKALPQEVKTWQANRAVAGRSDESGKYLRAFLVPIVNPLKFADDDDHD